MGWLAGLLYLVGLGLTFGCRSRAQRRLTGDAGLRLRSGPPGSLRWWAKVLFLAALALGFAGPVAAIAGLPPIPALAATGVGYAGIGVAVLGTAGSIVAQVALGPSWRIGVDPAERTTLVTDGPFTVARNPIFTAMVVAYFGIALMVPNPAAIVGLAALIAAVQLQVRGVEEPYLLTSHGQAYRRYAARVGRFLPGLGRLRAEPAQGIG